MKKLLLLLLLSLSLSNTSFAGVKDISLKCEGIMSSHDRVTSTSQPTTLIVSGISNNRVSIKFLGWFKHADILEGIYKLSEENPIIYHFNKDLKLDGKKGKAYIVLHRENAATNLRFYINVDYSTESYRVTEDSGVFIPYDVLHNPQCELIKQLF